MPTKISEHFTLEELTSSQTAARDGIDNRPSEREIDALHELCGHILQPLRRQTHVSRAAKLSVRAGLFISLVSLLCACAYTHVKPDGSVVIVGLNMITLPAGTVADGGSRTISSSALGVALFHTPIGSSISLGYTRDGFTMMGEDPRVSAAACLSADWPRANMERGTQYVSSVSDDMSVHVWRDGVGLLDLGLLRY